MALVFRGSFSPPEVLRVGHIPIATEMSVTIATSGHYLHDMLRMAKETLSAGPSPLLARQRFESRPGEAPPNFGRR